MSNDIEQELSAVQWEVLKALRDPVARRQPMIVPIIEELVVLGLVSIDNGVPTMTQAGRTVLVRGSSRLLDLAA